MGHAERGECAAWRGGAHRSTCRISEPFEMGGAQFGIALHMLRSIRACVFDGGSLSVLESTP